MQSSDNDKIAIKILGKDFLINCPHEAQSELMETAEQLNQRMQAIKTGGKVFGLDRIAIMTALNLTHELINAQQELALLRQQQQQLNERINAVLNPVSND